VRYLDLRSLLDADLECDLCIVGSGPAGATLACEFAGTRTRVLLVESGDREDRPETAALNELENVGAPRQPDQGLVRSRSFGGTAQIWTGRCGVLDPLDFEAREWVPLSGWPFERQTLAGHIMRAADQLGLMRVDYDDLPEDRPERAALGRATPDVTPHTWQFSEDPIAPGVPWRADRALQHAGGDNLQVLLNATAIEIIVDANGSRAESIEVASLTGKRARIHAQVFVLCAGAIETPRLLLASRRVLPEGVGNRRDVVGRYLTDHPRCVLGQIDPVRGRASLARYGFHRVTRGDQVRLFLRGLTLSPALQRQERLLHSASWLRPVHAEDDPWDALRRVRSARRRRDQLRAARSIVTQPGLFGGQLRRRLFEGQPALPKADRLDVLCDVEQCPDASSRLTLSSRRDALGVPKPCLDWRVGPLERRTVQRFAQAIELAFTQLGLPTPILTERVRAGRFEPMDFIDAAHPSGTTRMATDPACGVVDANSQVHGIERLFIAGSSVFPTNGHVNPTLTIVALSLRLADWLKRTALA
jgi:choline dehydrogenase-like flavoprotein